MNRGRFYLPLWASLALSASGTACLSTVLYVLPDGGRHGEHHLIHFHSFYHKDCSFNSPQLQAFEAHFTVRHEFGGSHPKGFGQRSNVDETDIALASFHTSNVGAVKSGQFG